MDAQTTIARVREVVAATGLTQGDFAVKAGLDAAKMSKSLAGTRRFTSLDLANIADVGGVSVDYLLGVDSPTPAIAARATVADADAILVGADRARDFAEIRANLAKLGFKPRAAAEIRLPRHGTSVDQGESLADEAVNAMDAHAAGASGAGDLADMVERVFGIDVAVCDLPVGCDGLTWRDPQSGYQVIVVATSNTPTRQRFTIAHELGHALARDGDHGLQVDQNVSDPSLRRLPAEQRANAFAAAFLMPADRVKQAMKQGHDASEQLFCEMVMQFGVSPSALAYRMTNLGLISRDDADTLHAYTAAGCARHAKQTDVFASWIAASRTERVPQTLVADCMSAYFAGLSTLRPLANLLRTDTATLRASLQEHAPSSGHTEDPGATFEP